MKKVGDNIEEKYLLTIREAAKYFHVGEKKIRQLVEEHCDANWFLTIGNRVMIKRLLFEKFIDEASVL